MIPRRASCRPTTAFVLTAAAVASCPSPPTFAAVDAKITGTATYRERIALTRAAVFEATLEDVSRADAPATVVARVRRTNPGQVPIAFEIGYDSGRIVARRSYVVRATIRDGGRLLFTTTEAYPVLTQGHARTVRLLMRRASASSDEDAEEGGGNGQGAALGSLPATFGGLIPCADCRGIRVHLNLLPGGAYMQRMAYLRDGHDAGYYELGAWTLSGDGRTLTLDGGRQGHAYWLVKDTRTLRKLDRDGNAIDSEVPEELTRRAALETLEPRVTLSGMFRAQADAPRFRDCRSDLEWPVQMSDDYRALERAYGQRRAAPGSALMVSLQGRIEERPRMEGGGTAPTLIVEKFLRAMPGESCPDRDPPTGLAHTRWRPILVGGRDVVLSGQQREPWIVLDPRGLRVTGSGGCNRISGTYEAGAGTLHFGPLITTRMFCAAGQELETTFLRALENTRRYRSAGRILELLDERGRLLARLEERNLD